jgi:DNA replication protein DnaC
MEKAKAYWEAICPPQFRDHKKDHPKFPKAQYLATKDYLGGESLLLFGPTGSGKTSLAMWLAKRCLVRCNMHVGVLWPEQLKAVKGQREILQWVEKWGRYDLLVLDDALLTGAQDERITDALKDLLDYRMRYNRPNILSSQIGGEEYKAQADKFENVTAADLKRVDALLRRLRETCRVVSFAEAKPAANEESF